jgi:hypothetical protein
VALSRARTALLRNYMILEFKNYRKQLAKVDDEKYRILAEQMDNFNWPLAEAFLKNYLTRCSFMSIMRFMQY